MSNNAEKLSPRILEIHRQACERGENLYEDPETGNFVMTSFYLRNRRRCCGNGCRHCPWPPAAQRAAERPDVPAYPHPET